MRRLALLLLLATAGCGTGALPVASAAAKDVRQRAGTAGIAMANAGRTSTAVDHARRVVGDVGSAAIELLEQEGTGIKGHVVLRITVTVEPSGYAGGSHASACFRYDFADSSGGTAPHETGCPHVAALVLPSPVPVPVLPLDAQDRLRRALGAANPDRAVPLAFVGTQVVVRTARVGDVIGASVQAGRDCDYGRRLAGGVIEIWYVPRVLSQPGEGGCQPEAAAAGQSKTSPH